MALDIGGFEQTPNWPKMGPSLLTGTCLILAIRTAKWSAIFDERCGEMDLDREIAYAAHLAGRVLAALVGSHENIFPSRMEPWYQARMKIAQSDNVATLTLLSLATQERLTGDELTGARERVEILSTGEHQPYRFKLGLVKCRRVYKEQCIAGTGMRRSSPMASVRRVTHSSGKMRNTSAASVRLSCSTTATLVRYAEPRVGASDPSWCIIASLDAQN
jgi:hypothetical protein